MYVNARVFGLGSRASGLLVARANLQSCQCKPIALSLNLCLLRFVRYVEDIY